MKDTTWADSSIQCISIGQVFLHHNLFDGTMLISKVTSNKSTMQ